jgi:hypothetical protein
MRCGEEDQMPESGEWFSPRTRPEMLTSDDPPVPADKPELVRILPGAATTVGRAAAPLRNLVGLVPAIGRRIVRVDADQPSRWQLAGMWASGSAIVAATALAVATVVGGAPAVLTQPFEQLKGLPGIGNERSEPDAVSSADKAAGSDAKPDGSARGSDGGSQSTADGYSGGSAGSVVYPEDLVPGRAAVAGVSSAGSSSGGSSGSSSGSSSGGSSTGSPTTPGGGGTTSPPASQPTSAPTTQPPTTQPPTTDPTTDPTTPTDPGTPTEDPTDSPTTDPPTAEPTPDPTAPPPDQPPADDPPVEQSTVTPTPDPTSPPATP